ncbi:GLTP protein, partial [Picathartes gymnocephalus]|nr:GLTP protein [Picathartes gymnocephalus]
MALLLEHEFKPLPADKQIETLPFLEAVAHLPPFFDCLGTPIVYSPVKADLTGNIKKIRAVYDSNPAKFKTLQNILEVEKELHGSAWPKTGATLALMWLKRGLKFILVLLQSISDGERDEEHPNLIRVNALKAYEIALKKYHGWMLQKLFTGSVYALPYKSDLLKALEKGKEVKEEESIEKIHQFVTRVAPILDAIYEMYTKMNAELSYKA